MSKKVNSKFFRNKKEMGEIEADCLWTLTENKLILCDEDEFVQLSYPENKEKFYLVDDPQISSLKNP